MASRSRFLPLFAHEYGNCSEARVNCSAIDGDVTTMALYANGKGAMSR